MQHIYRGRKCNQIVGGEGRLEVETRIDIEQWAETWTAVRVEANDFHRPIVRTMDGQSVDHESIMTRPFAASFDLIIVVNLYRIYSKWRVLNTVGSDLKPCWCHACCRH